MAAERELQDIVRREAGMLKVALDAEKRTVCDWPFAPIDIASFIWGMQLSCSYNPLDSMSLLIACEVMTAMLRNMEVVTTWRYSVLSERGHYKGQEWS